MVGKAYALRAPFLSPFIGGGLITTLVPILASTRGPLLTGAVSPALFLAPTPGETARILAKPGAPSG